MQDAPDGSAPREAMILPSGCMIRLEAGERLRLYAQGWSEGNGTRIPSRTMLTCILLEGKGAGAGIQGPAVIAPAPPEADAGARKGLRARFASLADAKAKRLQPEKETFSSLVVIPASYIVAGPDRRVRVMRPLPALSPPPNVVRLEDRRPA